MTVHLPIPRRDIADYLRVTVETVSRTVVRFARERVIFILP
ncbi:helix-turn-helix domain-containing protein [Bosea thiooxidans]